MDSDEEWDYTPKGIKEEKFEEDLEYLKNHPLFMKEVPKDIESHPDLKGLQNLLYNEDPINIAQYMNKKGNEYISKGWNKYTMKESLKCYDEGLAQDFEDNDLKARMYSNRAIVQTKYKNYGRAIEDALKAISLKKDFTKAYYRAGVAYFAIGKYEECKKICNTGLETDPKCEDFIKMIKDCDAKIESELKKQKDYQSSLDAKTQKLHALCKSKGIVLGKRIHEIPKSYEQDPYEDSEGALNFTTIISYPEFRQMDVIQKTKETDLLKDHLLEIFKTDLPWDEQKFYKYDDLVVLVELNCATPLYKLDKHTNYQEGFKRISRNKPISEILTINGYVMPNLLEIIVVSKKSPFYEKFLEDNEIVKKI